MAEERKEYMRKYYQEHKEEWKEYTRKYNQEHKEERKEHTRKYLQEHNIKTLSFQINPKLLDIINEACKEIGKNRSSFIRDIIKHNLSKYGCISEE